MSKLKDCVSILDNKRIPLSSAEREKLKKIYPYYGAQGIIDYVDDYIFDGDFILVAEDGNNLKSLKDNIATWATGKFWVNNHAHILGSKSGYSLRYIYYYLNSIDLRGYITGSAQPKLTKENLSNINLELPDYQTQCKVAHFLSSLDLKLENNIAICSELESMAKLIYDYWFVQFDFPDENGRPYKSSGGKMVWSKDLKREIPEGWEVTKLKNIFETERGISYNTANIETGKGIPMLNLATFRPGGGEYKSEGLKHFLGDCPKSKLLKPYDLIMCNTQQTSIKFETDIIGRAMLVPDIFENEITFSHHVNVIRTKNDDMKFFLLYLFNSDYFHKYIAGFTNGTNILGLSFNGVEDFITAIPSNELLSKFAKIIQPVFEKKSCIFKENQDLASLRDFLLPMLMNGQVKVKS